MDWMARATSIVGGAMVLLRRGAAPKSQATGQSPTIPEARKQGIMTLKMPTAKGWVGDHKPTAAPGLKVNAFARDLIHPRWIEVLPNGDVLVAEALQEEAASELQVWEKVDDWKTDKSPCMSETVSRSRTPPVSSSSPAAPAVPAADRPARPRRGQCSSAAAQAPG